MSDDPDPQTPPGVANSNAPADGSAEPASVAEPKAASSSKNRLRVVALVSAVVGMVMGAVVEMFVQGAMESTGWFGPTLESVMTEQVANFDAIQKKLDALNQATNESDRARLRKEIDDLLAQQRNLTGQTHTELNRYKDEVATLRERTLEKTGSAGGADVWLKVGESVTVGARQNVFSVLAVLSSSRARVNISGKISIISVGDYVEAPSDEGVWRVYFKQTSRDGDRTQLGFDLVAP